MMLLTGQVKQGDDSFSCVRSLFGDKIDFDVPMV